jgi:hypothetical protein
MSAAEIIQQFNMLPLPEQEKVADYVRRREIDSAPAENHHKVSEDFKRIAGEVFTTNEELFRKLAQ